MKNLNMKDLKHYAKFILVLVMILCLGMLSACGEAANGDAGTEAGPDGVVPSDDAVIQAISELTPPPTSTNDDPSRRTMTINRSESVPYDTTYDNGIVSIAEPPVLDITEKIPDEPEEEELEPGTYSGNGTPYVFKIADSTVIAFGEFDKAMADSIFAAINVYRANAHLMPLQWNQSLMFCADCRAKEASYSFTHFRENGTYWFTVAPKYYKAELMASDFVDAQETVDGWMQTATGRQYLLGEDLMSIGISVFKSGGRNYIICSLGE